MNRRKQVSSVPVFTSVVPLVFPRGSRLDCIAEILLGSLQRKRDRETAEREKRSAA